MTTTEPRPRRLGNCEHRADPEDDHEYNYHDEHGYDHDHCHDEHDHNHIDSDPTSAMTTLMT
jgi:hypothetical protein